MYQARTHTVPQIAATLGVSRATVYRHVADLAGR
jgi:AcrR family transcriptional regulator